MSQESQAGGRPWEGERREWRPDTDLLGKEGEFDANYEKISGKEVGQALINSGGRWKQDLEQVFISSSASGTLAPWTLAFGEIK